MAGLHAAEAGAAEHVVDHGPRLAHGLAHQPRLHRAHHRQRAVPGEGLGPLAPRGHRGRHVQVLALVAALLVEAVGDPGAEGEVYALSVSSDEQLPWSGRSEEDRSSPSYSTDYL